MYIRFNYVSRSRGGMGLWGTRSLGITNQYITPKSCAKGEAITSTYIHVSHHIHFLVGSGEKKTVCFFVYDQIFRFLREKMIMNMIIAFVIRVLLASERITFSQIANTNFKNDIKLFKIGPGEVWASGAGEVWAWPYLQMLQHK